MAAEALRDILLLIEIIDRKQWTRDMRYRNLCTEKNGI